MRIVRAAVVLDALWATITVSIAIAALRAVTMIRNLGDTARDHRTEGDHQQRMLHVFPENYFVRTARPNSRKIILFLSGPNNGRDFKSKGAIIAWVW